MCVTHCVTHPPRLQCSSWGAGGRRPRPAQCRRVRPAGSDARPFGAHASIAPRAGSASVRRRVRRIDGVARRAGAAVGGQAGGARGQRNVGGCAMLGRTRGFLEHMPPSRLAPARLASVGACVGLTASLISAASAKGTCRRARGSPGQRGPARAARQGGGPARAGGKRA